MTLRVLVTGANGFAGGHLCVHLRQMGDEVIEVAGPGPSGTSDPALAIDITDRDAVRAAIEEVKPEAVIHLAGFSSVGKSHQDPARVFTVNTVGTVQLLTALRDRAPRARFVLVSSAEVYGPVEPGTRATEEHPLRPLSPYAASKAAAELAGLQMHRANGLAVIVARSFNHIGRGQSPAFVVPSFAAQIEAIHAGRTPPVIRVGDLSPVRDFSHVHDVVEAYRLLALKGVPGQTYNVCSGEGRTIASLLDEMLELSGVAAHIERDDTRLRPTDLPGLVGDPTRLRQLGWRPALTVKEALRDALDGAGPLD